MNIDILVQYFHFHLFSLLRWVIVSDSCTTASLFSVGSCSPSFMASFTSSSNFSYSWIFYGNFVCEHENQKKWTRIKTKNTYTHVNS